MLARRRVAPRAVGRDSRLRKPRRAGRRSPTSSIGCSRPIALYPDALLAQMLLCAANPARSAALNEWLAAIDAQGQRAAGCGRQPGSSRASWRWSLFPDVVDSDGAQLEWTTQLGEAFAADRSAVFASIQRLRKKASQAGKLKSTPQQEVETKTTSSGEQVIVIEPANPQVVYVPQYNPQTVYTASSTVVVQEETTAAEAVAAGLIGFTAGIALGAAIDNDYYYGPYGWHGGGYMYNDAWDDYYDAPRGRPRGLAGPPRGHARRARRPPRRHRRRARRSRGTTQEQRTERQQNAQQQRTERQAQPRGRRRSASSADEAERDGVRGPQHRRREPRSRAATAAATRPTRERSGTGSDAFSGYSSGKSERAASSRGQSSRSSSSRAAGGGDEHPNRERVRRGGRPVAARPPCSATLACRPAHSRTADVRIAGGRREGAHRRRQGGKLDELMTLFGPDAQQLVDSSDPQDRAPAPRSVRRRRRRGVAARRQRPDGRVAGRWPRIVAVSRSARERREPVAIRHRGRQRGSPARRIGRNELAAIRAAAPTSSHNRLYASRGHDGKPAGLYATAFRSDPGRHNGLYWPAAAARNAARLAT